MAEDAQINCLLEQSKAERDFLAHCIQFGVTSDSMPCYSFKKLTELLFKSNYFLDFSIPVAKLYRI